MSKQWQPAEVPVPEDVLRFIDAATTEHDRIREAYPVATWERLVAIKKRYDPTNLFHLNHNVVPG